MTDSSFFGAEAASDGVAGSGGRRKLVVGGLVAAVALGAGGFFLLGGDDGDDDAAFRVATSAPAEPAAEPGPQVAVVPLAVTSPVGRNPFAAQYVEPGSAAGGAPVTTPKEIIEQSRPVTVPGEGEGMPAAPSGGGTAPAVTPPSTPTGTPPGAAPSTSPAPALPADDGVRYPVTLQALDAESEGVGGLIRWGYAGNSLHVRPGVNFGRFTHLRVVQVVDAADRQGVMLQWGDGAPYFVAVGETVYVL